MDIASINHILLVGGFLLFASILATALSARTGLPLLLVFLVVGMLAGEDGPGGIVFDNVAAAYLIGQLALAIILLDGGLRTDMRSFRVSLRPALTLATLGVALSAGILGALAVAIAGFDWKYGLLIGAIVGSTDAAAVFALLRHGGVRLNDRVGPTLEVESGINDPMAIVLTLLLIEAIRLDRSLLDPAFALFFVEQFGIGALGGVLLGLLLRKLLEHLSLNEGLYAPLIAAGGLLAFALITQLGGSGFLAVYLIGLLIGNARNTATFHVLRVMDGLAWLAQAGMFLILGLLITPSELLDSLGIALALAFALMFIARPLAVTLCLLPFRFRPRETLYIAWVGLRGAVPIVLALFPLMFGLPHAQTLFQIAFVVVIVSLLLQGSTVALAARRLGVVLPPVAEPLRRTDLPLPVEPPLSFMQFKVEENATARGLSAASLPRFDNLQTIGVVRERQLRPIGEDCRFKAGDVVCVLAEEAAAPALVAFFSDAQAQTQSADDTLCFMLDGRARLADIRAFYALDLPDAEEQMSLSAYLRLRLGERLVTGDTLEIAGALLRVLEMHEGHVTRVGLSLTDGAR